MISFLRKHAKLVFIGLILLLVAVAYANYGFWKLWGIGCKPDPGPVEPVVVVDDWSKPLSDAGFKPADIVDPVHVPVDIPAGVPIIYGYGTVDSVEVEVIGVETPDGGKWIRVTVAGKPVHFEKLDWIDAPEKSADNDFSLLLAGALVGDSPDVGVGLAWEPLRFAGARIGLECTVDVNRDIVSAPGWLAVGARVSRRMGPVSFGAGAGYRLGESAGLHLGVSAGLAIGI